MSDSAVIILRCPDCGQEDEVLQIAGRRNSVERQAGALGWTRTASYNPATRHYVRNDLRCPRCSSSTTREDLQLFIRRSRPRFDERGNWIDWHYRYEAAGHPLPHNA